MGAAVDVTPTGDIVSNTTTGIYVTSPITGASTLIAGHATTSGYADGTTGAARFNGITDVAVASDGTMYVTDSSNYRVRKVTTAGVVTTPALGVSSSISQARFKEGTLYVILGNRIDSFTFIRRADGSYITSNGGRGVNAGAAASGYADGVGSAARFNTPKSIAIDADGAVYVVDRNNSRIRKIE